MRFHNILAILLACSGIAANGQTGMPMVDLNDPKSFYGTWQGNFYYKATRENVPLEFVVGNDAGTKEMVVEIIDSKSGKRTRILPSFEGGTLRVPYRAQYIVGQSDSCTGYILISMLDENNLSGAFNGPGGGCMTLEFRASKTTAKTQVIRKPVKEEEVKTNPEKTAATPSVSAAENVRDNQLSEGARLLFKGVQSKLSNSDKNQVFVKSGFILSKDKSNFYAEPEQKDNPDAYFDAHVDVIDLNLDGVEEVFIHWGNWLLSGNVSQTVYLYIKKNGEYEFNLGFGGLAFITADFNNGFPDLLIGGPGFIYPLWRWNGRKYVFYKKLNGSSAEYKKLKLRKLKSIKDYTG